MREIAKAREAARRALRAQRLQEQPVVVEARVAAQASAGTTGDPVAPPTSPVPEPVAEPVAATVQATEPEPFGPWLPCILTAVDAPFPGWVSFRDYPGGPAQSSPRSDFELRHGPIASLTVQPEPDPHRPGRGPTRAADLFDYDMEGDRLPSAFVRLIDTGDVDVHAGKIFRQ